MDIASEVTEEEVNMDDNYGGVDALAKAIQHILDRLKVSITNIKFIIRQPSSDRRREFAIRVNIHKVEFFDCIREEANSTANTDDDKEEDVLLIRPFATKVLRLVQPSLEFSDSPLPPVNTDMATNMFRSQEFSEHSSQNTTQTYRDQVHWSLFAMATDKVEVQLKVKQQEEVPGHKIELEGFCGAMHMLLSPEQLRSLTEMVSLIAAEALAPQTPQTVTHEIGKNRPIRSQEYTHLESQLERQMMDHHYKVLKEREMMAQDPFRHPLDDDDPMNQSLSDLTAEDTFYSIELTTSSVYDGDLPPLGNPPKVSLRSDQFHSIQSSLLPSTPRMRSESIPSTASITSAKTMTSKGSDWTQEDTSVYRFTLSALTVSVLHSEHIGLIHQDLLHEPALDSLGKSLGSVRSGEGPVGPTYSREDSIEGDDVLRSKYLKSLAAQYAKKDRTTIEDLGSAVPTDHLLVWLSTVKWEVSQSGADVDIETTFSKALLLENLFADAQTSLSSTFTPLCCNQLLKLSSLVEPTSSHPVTSPCFRMTYSSHHSMHKKQSGRSHSKSKTDVVKLNIDISMAEVELDVTLVDRLDLLVSATRFSQPSSLQSAKNYTSLYLNRDTSHLIKQRREEVFKQNLEDSSPTPLQWGLHCHSVQLLVKFPVPNSEQGSVSNPSWMQFQKMYDEKLLLNLSKVTMETTLDPTSYEELYNVTFDQLRGSLIYDGCPNGEQFLCVGEGEREDQCIPEIRVRRCFQTTTDLDTPTPGEDVKNIGSSLGDSILEGIERGCATLGTTPFSTQRTTHIPGEQHTESDVLFGEKVLPGTDSELEEFRFKTGKKSLFHVACKLPYIMVNFSTKDFFDLLYNRLVNDLLSWEPQWHSLDSSTLNSHSMYNPIAPPPVEDVFKPCYSLQEEESEVEPSGFDHKVSHSSTSREEKGDLGKCMLSLHVIFDEAVVTIATTTVSHNEIPQEEESLVSISSPRDHSPPKITYSPLEVRLTGLDVFMCSYQRSSVQHLAVQVKELTLGNLEGVCFLKPSDAGYKLSEVKYKSFLTVAMETRPSPTLFKTTKWALMLSQGTMEHHVAKCTWLTQLVDFVTLPTSSKSSVATPPQPMAVNLLHLHLRDSCVEYKPLHLPLAAVLWMDDVSLSTSIVQGSDEFSTRLLLDSCCLFLSHLDTRSCGLNDAVCVMEAGPLDLVLKSSVPDASSKDAGRSLVLELSGGHVIFRTCADSCVALRDLVLYLASDGDLIMSQTKLDNEETVPSPAAGDFTTQPILSDHSDVSNHILEAIEDEQPSLSSCDGKRKPKKSASSKTELTDKGTCVIFDSDSESDSSGKITRPGYTSAVSSSLGSSQSQLLSSAARISSPPKTPFPDEMEDEGFLVYEPTRSPNRIRASRGVSDKPAVRYLCTEDQPLELKDNYFTKPSGYVDRLQRPRHYPPPVSSYTLKEIDVLWVWYGGCDFTNYLKRESSNSKMVAGGDVFGAMKKKSASGWGIPKKRAKDKEGRDPLARDRGGVARDRDVQVEMSLSKVRTRYEVYPSTAKECSRLVVVVHDAEVRDRLRVSEINKLLYQNAREGLPKQTHANMLSLKLVFVRPDLNDPLEEGSVRISVLPVRVNLDQDTAYFLHNFFLDISLAPVPLCLTDPHITPPVITSKQLTTPSIPQLYIKTFTFSPDVPIRVDYVAKHIDIDKGNITGFLAGLSHLNCLQLSIKSIHTTRGFTSWSELLLFVIDQWQADITSSQLPRMISGVGPLHYITQFVNGFVDLVWLPWQQYQEDGRILRGLQRGASSFTASSGAASLELSSRLVSAFESFVRMVNNVTGDTSTDARPPLHPQGMYDGLTTAYNVVTEGVSGTVTEAVQTVYNEHEDRGVAAALGGVVRFFPRVLFRPIIHVSEATRLALTGMRNELLPEVRKEESEKYRMKKN
jgi:autophagy-related protein 2